MSHATTSNFKLKSSQRGTGKEFRFLGLLSPIRVTMLFIPKTETQWLVRTHVMACQLRLIFLAIPMQLLLGLEILDEDAEFKQKLKIGICIIPFSLFLATGMAFLLVHFFWHIGFYRDLRVALVKDQKQREEHRKNYCTYVDRKWDCTLCSVLTGIIAGEAAHPWNIVTRWSPLVASLATLVTFVVFGVNYCTSADIDDLTVFVEESDKQQASKGDEDAVDTRGKNPSGVLSRRVKKSSRASKSSQ